MNLTVRLLADAGPEIGLGHFTRCFALGQALEARGAVVTLECSNPDWVKTLTGEETVPFSSEPADLIILDRYDLPQQEISDLKKQCRTLAVIDDHFRPPPEAAIVINHNLYGDPDRYRVPPGVTVLAGTDYTLLRSEFEGLRGKPEPQDKRILVALGGGDYAIGGIRIANMLRSTFEIGVDLVLNSEMAKSAEGVEAGVKVLSGDKARDAMAKATVYVGGLGVSMIEARALGLHLVGIQTADNQKFAVQWAREHGFRVLDSVPQTDDHFRALADAVRTGLAKGRDLPAKPDGTGAGVTAEALLSLLS